MYEMEKGIGLLSPQGTPLQEMALNQSLSDSARRQPPRAVTWHRGENGATISAIAHVDKILERKETLMRGLAGS